MLSMFDELAEKSWTVQNSWMSPADCNRLLQWAQDQHHQGRFQSARVGQSPQLQIEIRNDSILWLEREACEITKKTWDQFEDLRLSLNRNLYLGLDHFELHFALYPPGHFYQAHLDQGPLGLQGAAPRGERVITTVLYLNALWQESDAGELVLYPGGIENPEDQRTLLPEQGRMILFDSKKMLHEVRAPHRERWSLTGWFRRR